MVNRVATMNEGISFRDQIMNCSIAVVNLAQTATFQRVWVRDDAG